jgi:hypothetical protein
METEDVVDPLLLKASMLGHRLFRNNQGVGRMPDGSMVKFGIGAGGSDTIGWTRLVVTPGMVGHVVAVFTAIEAKAGIKKPTKQQQAFLATVREHGGLALWGNDSDDIMVEWMRECERKRRGE